jgi:hypothetical protein
MALALCSNPSLSVLQLANSGMEFMYMFSEKGRRASSARVLLLFRDGTVSDWAGLCRAFDLDPDNHFATPNAFLREIVWALIQANLLVIDNPDPLRWELVGDIKASDNVPGLLWVLDLSLKEMAAVDPRRSMFIEPSFGRPDSIPPDKQLDLFVLMPFSSNIKGVYEDHIKSVAASLCKWKRSAM